MLLRFRSFPLQSNGTPARPALAEHDAYRFKLGRDAWAVPRMGVPVLLLPFTIPNPYEAAVILGRRRAYQVRGPIGRLFAALRPQWVLGTSEGRKIRLPVAQALMIEMARLAPARPWIDNDGP